MDMNYTPGKDKLGADAQKQIAEIVLGEVRRMLGTEGDTVSRERVIAARDLLISFNYYFPVDQKI